MFIYINFNDVLNLCEDDAAHAREVGYLELSDTTGFRVTTGWPVGWENPPGELTYWWEFATREFAQKSSSWSSPTF